MSEPVKELRFVPSTKGKDLAVLDQYIYERDRISKETRYFICQNHKKGCPARLIVYENGTYKERNVHMNYIPNRERVKSYELVNHAKNVATGNPALPMSEVLSQVENLMVNDENVAPEMGPTIDLKRRIRRARRLVRGEIPTGITREELIIPDHFLKTKSGDTFLLKDYPGNDRMIIFSTMDSLRVRYDQLNTR